MSLRAARPLATICAVLVAAGIVAVVAALAAPGQQHPVALAGPAAAPPLAAAAAPAKAEGEVILPLDARGHLDQLAQFGRDLQLAGQTDTQYVRSPAWEQIITLAARVDDVKAALAHVEAGGALPGGELPSRFAGMTQTQPSLARCGDTVVAGYFDSSALVRTLLGSASPSGSLSFNGWSLSTNGGATFADRGPLIADPVTPDIFFNPPVQFRDLFGDPAVACSNASTFYYAAVAVQTQPGVLIKKEDENGGTSELIVPPRSSVAIVVSKSVDGGRTWGGAVPVLFGPGFPDSPAIAVTPGRTPAQDIVHVTYTSFISRDGFPQEGCDLEPSIVYQRSVDGGATWSLPVVVDRLCIDRPHVGGDPILQGSRVQAGLDGDVYVAWEKYAAGLVTREIRVARSTDAGRAPPTPTITPTFPPESPKGTEPPTPTLDPGKELLSSAPASVRTGTPSATPAANAGSAPPTRTPERPPATTFTPTGAPATTRTPAATTGRTAAAQAKEDEEEPKPTPTPAASFGPPLVVAPVTPIGDGLFLQGGFRVFGDLQGLAVDTSAGPNRGTVYVAWHDGRNLNRPDLQAFNPIDFNSSCLSGVHVYCFADVLLSRSTDGGQTWSAPVRVNDDPVTQAADQYAPALVVDGQGTVFVAYHDRARDPRNYLIDVTLARSRDGGRTWSSQRLSRESFPPLPAWHDFVVTPSYMGGSLGLAADFTRTRPGAVVAWGDTSRGDATIRYEKRE